MVGAVRGRPTDPPSVVGGAQLAEEIARGEREIARARNLQRLLLGAKERSAVPALEGYLKRKELESQLEREDGQGAVPR